MIFHVLTIFPEFFQGPFAHGVVKRAADAGILEIRIHNLRDWTFDRHKTVDDRPFGGGEGMVLKAEPIFLAVESIWPERKPDQQPSYMLAALCEKPGPKTAIVFAAVGLLRCCQRQNRPFRSFHQSGVHNSRATAD